MDNNYRTSTVSEAVAKAHREAYLKTLREEGIEEPDVPGSENILFAGCDYIARCVSIAEAIGEETGIPKTPNDTLIKYFLLSVCKQAYINGYQEAIEEKSKD